MRTETLVPNEVKINLTEEQRRFLCSLSYGARKYVITALKEGQDFDNIRTVAEKIETIERRFGRIWRNFMFQQLNFYKFSGEIAQFCNKLKQPNTRYEHILNLAQKRNQIFMSDNHDSKGDKYLNRFIRILSSYLDKVNRLQKRLLEAVRNNQSFDEVVALAEEVTRQEKLLREDFLYMRQTTKNILNRCELGVAPTLDRIKIALDVRFSDDPDILEKQADVILASYELQKTQNSPEAKDTMLYCFDFIGRSFEVSKAPNAKLITYLFKENFISDDVYQMLLSHKKEIKRYGMNALISTQASKLAEGLSPDPLAKTASDKRILSLVEEFGVK